MELLIKYLFGIDRELCKRSTEIGQLKKCHEGNKIFLVCVNVFVDAYTSVSEIAQQTGIAKTYEILTYKLHSYVTLSDELWSLPS